VGLIIFYLTKFKVVWAVVFEVQTTRSKDLRKLKILNHIPTDIESFSLLYDS